MCACRSMPSKSELDNYTDKIENVLSSPRGRRLFKNYLKECQLRDGQNYVKFYHYIDNVVAYLKSHNSIMNIEHKIQRIKGMIDDYDELDPAYVDEITSNLEENNVVELCVTLKKVRKDIRHTTVMKDSFRLFQKEYSS